MKENNFIGVIILGNKIFKHTGSTIQFAIKAARRIHGVNIVKDKNFYLYKNIKSGYDFLKKEVL